MRKTGSTNAEVALKDAVEDEGGMNAQTTTLPVPVAAGSESGKGRAPGVRGSSASRKASERQNPDPLFVIFEQHLLNFQDPDIDRKTFIAKVVDEYLGMLRQKNITVPKSLEQPIVEELATQVNAMLVKRIYGSSTIAEFRARHVKIRRRRTSSSSTRKSARTG